MNLSANVMLAQSSSIITNSVTAGAAQEPDHLPSDSDSGHICITHWRNHVSQMQAHVHRRCVAGCFMAANEQIYDLLGAREWLRQRDKWMSDTIQNEIK